MVSMEYLPTDRDMARHGRTYRSLHLQRPILADLSISPNTQSHSQTIGYVSNFLLVRNLVRKLPSHGRVSTASLVIMPANSSSHVGTEEESSSSGACIFAGWWPLVAKVWSVFPGFRASIWESCRQKRTRRLYSAEASICTSKRKTGGTEHFRRMRSEKCIASLIHCSIYCGSSVHWFIDPWIHGIMDSVIHWCVDSVLCMLLHRFIASLIHGFLDWMILWLIESVVHPLRISLLQWFFDSRIHCFSDNIESVIHQAIRSLIHCWAMDSLIQQSLERTTSGSGRSNRNRRTAAAATTTSSSSTTTTTCISSRNSKSHQNIKKQQRQQHNNQKKYKKKQQKDRRLQWRRRRRRSKKVKKWEEERVTQKILTEKLCCPMAPADEKNQAFHWLTAFIGSWIQWLIDSLTQWFIDSSFPWFTIHWLIQWFSDPVCFDSLILRVIGSSSQLCVDSFMSSHWHLNSHLLIRWCTSQLQHHLSLILVFFSTLPPRDSRALPCSLCHRIQENTLYGQIILLSFDFNPLIFGSCPPWTCYQATSKGPRAFLGHQRRCSSAAPQGRRRRNMAPRTWCDGSWATDGWSMSGSYI